MVEIRPDGVVLPDLTGVDKAVEVTIPGGKTCLEGTDGHRVLVFLGQRTERIAGEIPLAELGLTGEFVEAQLVMGVHEMACLPHEQHVLTYFLQGTFLPTGHLAVGIGKGTGGRRVHIAAGIMTQRTEGGGGFPHLHLHVELCLIENLSAMAGGGTDDTYGKAVVADKGQERLGEFGGEVAQAAGFVPGFQTVDFQQGHFVAAEDLGLEMGCRRVVVVAAFLQDAVMSLLDEGCIAIVPVDTSFETHISGINEKSQYPLVSENTLHGMWLSRIKKCGYSEEDIKAQIKESLIQHMISPLNSADFSTIEHYPIGTIAQFSHTKNCFYLIAISEFNEQNIAYSDKDKIEFCLQRLIEYYNIYGQGYHLYIPLLGTGRSRANLSYQDSFDLILDTFMKHKQLLQGKISIVIQPNIKELKIIME